MFVRPYFASSTSLAMAFGPFQQSFPASNQDATGCGNANASHLAGIDPVLVVDSRRVGPFRLAASAMASASPLARLKFIPVISQTSRDFSTGRTFDSRFVRRLFDNYCIQRFLGTAAFRFSIHWMATEHVDAGQK